MQLKEQEMAKKRINGEGTEGRGFDSRGRLQTHGFFQQHYNENVVAFGVSTLAYLFLTH